MIPYISFSIIYVILQHFGGNVHNLNSWKSLETLYAQPIGYMWFLYVLFFIFCLAGLMGILQMSLNQQLIISLILFIVSQMLTLPYFLSGTFTWIICFILGSLFRENKKYLSNWVIFIMSVILIVSWFCQWRWGENWYQTNVLTLYNFPSKIASVFIGFKLFLYKNDGPLFKYFKSYGPYSLIIYLVHAPAASIVRTLLIKVGISNYFVLLILIIALAWGISILACYLSRKLWIVNVFFYPSKLFKGTFLH